MAKSKRTTTTTNVSEAEILELKTGRVTLSIKGVTPLIYNAMSAKVLHGLLQPSKKTTAEKASTLKHDPLAEFRACVYRSKSKEAPTLLSFPAVAFKRGMASAAIDVGIAKRTQIDRLSWAVGEEVHIYGIPKLRMDVVRSADMNRTPDIRTRACLEEWCCELTIAYQRPMLTPETLIKLISASGMIRGIGDFRQEKGAGNYGQFEIVDADNADFIRLKKTAGRAAQLKAMESPICYNEEAAGMLAWWRDEAKRLGRTPNEELQ